MAGTSSTHDSFPWYLQRISDAKLEETARDYVRLSERICLSIDECAKYTGLGVRYIRRMIAEGKLPVKKGAGRIWKGL